MPCSLQLTRSFWPYLKLLLFLGALFFLIANALSYDIVIALFDLIDAFLDDTLKPFLMSLQTIICLFGSAFLLSFRWPSFASSSFLLPLLQDSSYPYRLPFYACSLPSPFEIRDNSRHLKRSFSFTVALLFFGGGIKLASKEVLAVGGPYKHYRNKVVCLLLSQSASCLP